MPAAARVFGTAFAFVLAATVAACGGSDSAAPAAPAVATTPVAAPPAVTIPAVTNPPATPPAAQASRKVSANTASEQQIAQALQAAGVRNAERWAEEVVEYRPYPADDPNLTKLRQKLAKYNPGQDTTDKIVSALTP